MLFGGFFFAPLLLIVAYSFWQVIDYNVVQNNLIGLSPRARAYIEPSLEFLRPRPASAIIPAI